MGFGQRGNFASSNKSTIRPRSDVGWAQTQQRRAKRCEKHISAACLDGRHFSKCSSKLCVCDCHFSSAARPD